MACPFGKTSKDLTDADEFSWPDRRNSPDREILLSAVCRFIETAHILISSALTVPVFHCKVPRLTTMVARFAGARSLDDRRRRRIATGTDIDISPPMPSSSVSNSRNEQSEEVPTRSSARSDHFPLRKLISPSLWKHALIGAAGLAVGASLLIAMAADWSAMSSYGSGVPQSLSLTAARAVTFYSGTLLFLAGQLSLLCWWARSRSTGDFSGSYRIWVPMAATLFIWAGFTVTGTHQLLGMISAQLLSVRMNHGVTLCWLVPTMLVGVVVLRPLSADMRGCRWSLSMLCFAVLGWLTAGWLLLGMSFPLAGAERELTQSGAALLGNWFVCMSILLHARHVIYVTAEPPTARPSRWTAMKSRLRRTSVDVPDPSGQTQHTDLDNDQGVEERPKPSTPATGKRSPAISPAASKLSAPANQQAESITAPVGKNKATSSGIRIDGPPTPEQLRGLNKRERRHLRKQWRDAQRQAKESIAP